MTDGSFSAERPFGVWGCGRLGLSDDVPGTTEAQHSSMEGWRTAGGDFCSTNIDLRKTGIWIKLDGMHEP